VPVAEQQLSDLNSADRRHVPRRDARGAAELDDARDVPAA
jgi:hypothetical protein